MTQCDCGAETTGKWAGKHTQGCALLSDRQWIVDLIRNEYDKAPDHYRLGDTWDDGAERIANQILARIKSQG